jgi:hypothetical protein
MYDTQSGITIEDALNRDGESIFSAQLMHLTYFLKGCVFFIVCLDIKLEKIFKNLCSIPKTAFSITYYSETKLNSLLDSKV